MQPSRFRIFIILLLVLSSSLNLMLFAQSSTDTISSQLRNYIDLEFAKIEQTEDKKKFLENLLSALSEFQVFLQTLHTTIEQEAQSAHISLTPSSDISGGAGAHISNTEQGISGSAVNPENTPGSPQTATLPLSGDFSYDEILPDPYSAFVLLRPGQTNIANFHVDPRTGTSGTPFASHIDLIQKGKSLRLRVLVPPGVNLVTWGTEASSNVAYFGACDSDGVICHDESYTPTLFPYGYNGQLPTATPVSNLPALTVPKIVYLTLKTQAIDYDFMTLTVNYFVKDPVLYENWRKARSWAGGSGDCDGLGGIYCSRP